MILRPGPVSRILILPTLGRLALLVGLVMAVFMAESFTTLLEEAIRNGGGSADVLWLLAFQAPEILDLALALGVLIALFFALGDLRNRGELVILATTGVRWTRVVGFALGLGCAGGLVSVAVSGYLVPAARFAERVTMTQLRSEHMLNQILRPGPRNSRQTVGDVTFIATPPRFADQQRGQLFAFRRFGDGTWRAAQSRDWTVEGPDASGAYRIQLNTTVAYEGRDANGAPPTPISGFRSRNTGMDFNLSEILPKLDALRETRERPLVLGDGINRRLAGVLARAILVPTAAILAVAAVLVSGGGIGRYLGLPAAAVMLLFYDVLGRTLVLDALGTVAAGPLIALTVAGYLGPPLVYVLWRGEAVMLPARSTA